MSALSRLPSGRRSKWVVLAVAVAVAIAGASQAGKFEDAQQNELSSFLPDGSESLRVRDVLPQFPSGRLVRGVVVYHRAEGLTEADQEKIALDREALGADPPQGVVRINDPVTSEDGTTTLLGVDITGTGLAEATKQVRRAVDETPEGLQVAVTGTAGYATDRLDAFESLDRRLLLGTAALVLLLLVAIYRSPIFWAIPFVAVVLTEVTSRGLGYGLTELGVTVNGQSAAILVVLVFGAATDYALLLVARYREELRRHEDKHAAMATALRRAGPAIIASGLTVIAALLCLSLAELDGTAGLGPIAAMGIALAMIAMLTLLPALALVGGRRAFWPFIPRSGEAAAAGATRGFWRRTGERIVRRPRRVWIATATVLAVMCAGLATLDTDLTSGSGFRDEVEAVEVKKLLARAFPAGESTPAIAVVGDPSRADDVATALEEHPAVARTGPVERGSPGARFDVILEGDPYGRAGLDAIPRLRRVAGEAGGATALIGGPTSEQHDLRASATRDNRVIAPVVLLVILAILAVLLRAIVAPLLLMLTVIASFAAALGVGAFVFQRFFGFEGMDPTLLFAFIFLVALGVDYNIFLMARVREEALAVGTREGMLRGLAVTGGVITSAGIVLAGTFSILATLPLVTLVELGFVVAFGVLLDTFVVRSVLVPALIVDVGPRSWWPSRLARDDRALGGPGQRAVDAESAAVAGGDPSR